MENVRFSRIIEMLEKEPRDAFLLYALAQEYLNAEQPEKAIEIFQKLLSYHPNNSSVFLHYGNAYLALGKTEIAISVYKKGIEICKNENAMHDLNELRSALNLIEED